MNERGRRPFPADAVEVYEYERPDKTVVFEKIKYVWEEDGERKKSFKIRYQTREQVASGSVHWWTWGAPPCIRRYPYELPRLLEAVMAGERIYIVEGEKDAHAVMDAWGYAATTHPTGSAGGVSGAGWTQEMAQWFAAGYRLGDRGGFRSEIVVVADADPTGLWLAARTAAVLRKWAAWDAGHIRVVLPAVDGIGADISDHITEDLTETSLVRVSSEELRRAAGKVDEVVRVAGFKVAFGSGGADEEVRDLRKRGGRVQRIRADVDCRILDGAGPDPASRRSGNGIPEPETDLGPAAGGRYTAAGVRLGVADRRRAGSTTRKEG